MDARIPVPHYASFPDQVGRQRGRLGAAIEFTPNCATVRWGTDPSKTQKSGRLVVSNNRSGVCTY